MSAGDRFLGIEAFFNGLQMQYIQSPVSTVCIGQACSMGSLLLTAGAQGQRTALPNSRIMVHQPRYENLRADFPGCSLRRSIAAEVLTDKPPILRSMPRKFLPCATGSINFMLLTPARITKQLVSFHDLTALPSCQFSCVTRERAGQG